LDIVGGCVAPDYQAELKGLVDARGLEGRVRFHGQVDRDALPAVYHGHDVLLFPSIWGEPFSITLLEAMSAGVAVVSTATGGTGEMLRDGENALLFPERDARACAARVARLLGDPRLLERLRTCARSTVQERFMFAGMVDQIEQDLQRGVAGLPSSGA
jgi:glycosyltransferase involved in cell wall biosynthesis